MVGRVRKKCKINLALQGGGAYGAFTWGVIDRLLQEELLELEGFSGTSSGALNAAVLATGLANGGRNGARTLLQSFWMHVGNLARTPSFSMSVAKSFKNFMPAAGNFVETALFLNQFTDITQLRTMVAQHVDCDIIAAKFPRFFVSATKLSTGQARIFEAQELSVDVLLASACLPYFFKAIEIDGEHYWDGGFSSNPPIVPLQQNTTIRDTLIIQLNSPLSFDVPKSKSDTISRMMEIIFNAPFLAELRLLAQENSRFFLHRITTPEEMHGLPPTNRLLPEKKFILRLKDLGFDAADMWLSHNFQSIGVKSSFQFQQE
jgi:NTE family protein